MASGGRSGRGLAVDFGAPKKNVAGIRFTPTPRRTKSFETVLGSFSKAPSLSTRCFASYSSAEEEGQSVPIYPIQKKEFGEGRLEDLFGKETAGFCRASGFVAEEGQLLPVPSGSGSVAGWLFGTGDGSNPFVFGLLPQKLPASVTYRIEGSTLSQEHYLGWGLGSYSFGKKYKSKKQSQNEKDEEEGEGTKQQHVLCVGSEEKKKELERIVSGVFLGRDLINTPCSDLGPWDLAREAEQLGKRFGASVKVIGNGEVLEKEFPMVHAVGRAAAAGREPLVVDLNWSAPSPGSKKEEKKLVTLVGKGVCFDTGGLDIKPPSSMLTMKKDMGGAASVLALASMIMEAKLDVRLRVLLPCVENCVAGNAFRPSDIIKTRSGLTVEIGNTDAEGRLILADCLTLATEDPNEQPDILLDMATLTGAHRVALGWDLPGIFTDNEELARDLYAKGLEHHDPVWRLPLWKPYAKMLDSRVADMNNIGSVPWGGAITAALFLQKFVNDCPNWVHIDFNGWTRDKPGFPEGGEPQAVRGIFEMLKEKYGTGTN